MSESFKPEVEPIPKTISKRTIIIALGSVLALTVVTYFSWPTISKALGLGAKPKIPLEHQAQNCLIDPESSNNKLTSEEVGKVDWKNFDGTKLEDEGYLKAQVCTDKEIKTDLLELLCELGKTEIADKVIRACKNPDIVKIAKSNRHAFTYSLAFPAYRKDNTVIVPKDDLVNIMQSPLTNQKHLKNLLTTNSTKVSDLAVAAMEAIRLDLFNGYLADLQKADDIKKLVDDAVNISLHSKHQPLFEALIKKVKSLKNPEALKKQLSDYFKAQRALRSFSFGWTEAEPVVVNHEKLTEKLYKYLLAPVDGNLSRQEASQLTPKHWANVFNMWIRDNPDFEKNNFDAKAVTDYVKKHKKTELLEILLHRDEVRREDRDYFAHPELIPIAKAKKHFLAYEALYFCKAASGSAPTDTDAKEILLSPLASVRFVQRFIEKSSITVPVAAIGATIAGRRDLLDQIFLLKDIRLTEMRMLLQSLGAIKIESQAQKDCVTTILEKAHSLIRTVKTMEKELENYLDNKGLSFMVENLEKTLQ